MAKENLARVVVVVLVISSAQMACKNPALDDHLKMSLAVTSPSFRQGDDIPKLFTCDGSAVSPALSWQAPPSGTKSLALIVSDPDSFFGSFVHWVLYNLPPESTSLPASVSKQPNLPDGSRQGLNSDDALGYYGPCPPGKSAHRYLFTLYALDTKLDLQPGAKIEQLRKAVDGHILAAGQLMGRYHR